MFWWVAACVAVEGVSPSSSKKPALTPPIFLESLRTPSLFLGIFNEALIVAGIPRHGCSCRGFGLGSEASPYPDQTGQG